MIIELNKTDIFYNLAVEEWLTRNTNEPTLILWKSNPTVVIGKNQNPWKECKLKLMMHDKISLARRISGGGAVYHDEGNINYSIIVKKRDYQQEKAFNMIISVLTNFNIKAKLKCKSNLTFKDKKFSGTAFAHKNNRVLHHGTILLNTDLKKLNKYLGSDLTGIKTRAISSIPAQVINLKISTKDLKKAIKNEFINFYNSDSSNIELDSKDINSILKQRKKDSWIFGNTPDFHVEYNKKNISFNHNNIPNNFSELKREILHIEKFYS